MKRISTPPSIEPEVPLTALLGIEPDVLLTALLGIEPEVPLTALLVQALSGFKWTDEPNGSFVFRRPRPLGEGGGGLVLAAEAHPLASSRLFGAPRFDHVTIKVPLLGTRPARDGSGKQELAPYGLI